MNARQYSEIKVDVLIIGAGGAGLRAAIESRRLGVSVAVVSKYRAGGGCNTAIAGGGIAAGTGLLQEKDALETHIADTLKSGEYVNDRKLVATLVGQCHKVIDDLTEFGVALNMKRGRINLIAVPGHSHNRVVKIGDRLGRGLSIPMAAYAKQLGVIFINGVWISSLLQKDNQVTGAVGIDRNGSFIVFRARSLILATGGAGSIYWCNDNAGGITGDGYRLAYEADVPLKDMEFVQFYPTATGVQGRTLISYESLVIRAGAVLRNADNEDIVKKHGLDGLGLLTRDNVARIIFREIGEGRGVNGGVIMDLSAISSERLEVEKKVLPRFTPHLGKSFVAKPTCHFFMGGVVINENAETAKEALFAAGEVCAGIHGANRLAGNAICELIVFGAIAGAKAAKRAKKVKQQSISKKQIIEQICDIKSLLHAGGTENIDELRSQLQHVMWQKAGIIRSKEDLNIALNSLCSLRDCLSCVRINSTRDLCRMLELKSLFSVSEMICRSALIRTESRGAHFRSDFPLRDDAIWTRNIHIENRGGVRAF